MRSQQHPHHGHHHRPDLILSEAPRDAVLVCNSEMEELFDTGTIILHIFLFTNYSP